MAVVDANDTVLPPELEGKTPQEIAAHYQQQQETILENARRMVMEAREGRQNTPPAGDPPPPPVPPQNVTREEFNRMTTAAQQGLIAVAVMTAKEGKPDWDRHSKDIKAIVGQLPIDQQINSAVWEECYFNVRGRATDTLINEARRSALGLEPPSPPPPVAAPPRVFTGDELSVIEGMGVTTKMYEDAEQKLSSGYQPFTTDNRRTA